MRQVTASICSTVTSLVIRFCAPPLRVSVMSCQSKVEASMASENFTSSAITTMLRGLVDTSSTLCTAGAWVSTRHCVES